MSYHRELIATRGRDINKQEWAQPDSPETLSLDSVTLEVRTGGMATAAEVPLHKGQNKIK